MRIGVPTGGGDVPGLNVAIKTAVREASRRGWSVLNPARLGGAGALDQADPASAVWLTTLTARTGAHHRPRTGGIDPCTLRASTRTCCPSPTCRRIWRRRLAGGRDLRHDAPHAEAIGALGLDALIVIGGDGIAVTARLAAEGVDRHRAQDDGQRRLRQPTCDRFRPPSPARSRRSPPGTTASSHESGCWWSNSSAAVRETALLKPGSRRRRPHADRRGRGRSRPLRHAGRRRPCCQPVALCRRRRLPEGAKRRRRRSNTASPTLTVAAVSAASARSS